MILSSSPTQAPEMIDATPNLAEPLDLNWISSLFPSKDAAKRQEWLSILREQEFETVEDLTGMDDAAWLRLALPVMVQTRIKAAIGQAKRGDGKGARERRQVPEEGKGEEWETVDVDVEMGQAPPLPKVTQIDMIVLDIRYCTHTRTHTRT